MRFNMQGADLEGSHYMNMPMSNNHHGAVDHQNWREDNS